MTKAPFLNGHSFWVSLYKQLGYLKIDKVCSSYQLLVWDGANVMSRKFILLATSKAFAVSPLGSLNDNLTTLLNQMHGRLGQGHHIVMIYKHIVVL